MHKCDLHSFIQEPVAGAVLLVVRAVRRADRADLRQVADAADVHLDRHDQLRRLEHPLPRRHHLLQQPRRRQAVQGGHQEETVRILDAALLLSMSYKVLTPSEVHAVL